MIRCRRTVLLIAGLWLPLLAAGSEQGQLFEREHLFKQLGVESGLAQSTVHALLQDRRGFLWVGTQGGLQRWDGHQWLSLQSEPGNPNSLPENLIRALCEHEGRLWVGTLGGHLAFIDQRTGQITRMRVGDSSADASIEALHCGVHGVHVGTRAGVYRIDTQLRVQRRHAGPAEALAVDADGRLWLAHQHVVHLLDAADAILDHWSLSAPVHQLHADPVHGLLVASASSLDALDSPSASLRRLWPAPGSAGGDVRAVQRAGDGSLWLAVRGRGLLQLSDDGDERWLPASPGVPGTLGDEALRSLLIDRSDRIWVGTDLAGVLHAALDGSPLRWWVPVDAAGPLSLRGLAEAGDGRLWLAGDHGELWSFDVDARRWQAHGQRLRAEFRLTGRKALQLHALASADGPRILLSSDAGLAWVDTGTGAALRIQVPPAHVVAAQQARALLRDRDGHWWLAAFGSGVFRVADGRFADPHAWLEFSPDAPEPRRLNNPHPLSLYQDRNGDIWVGSLDGLSRIRAERALSISADPDRAEGLAARVIRAFAEDDRGSLWIASHSGLLRMTDAGSGADPLRFVPMPGQVAAPGDLLYGLLADAQGQLWASGNRGLLRIDTERGALRRYGSESGAPSPEFNGGAQLRLSDGRLAFGNLRGLVLLDPTAIDAAEQPPTLLLRGWSSADQAQRLHDGRPPEWIDLPRAPAQLSLEFGTLDPGATTAPMLSWRLLGHAPQWQPAGDARSATWSRLTSGHYLFELRDDAHPDWILRAPIRVPAPAWRQPPALAGAAALTAMLMGWAILWSRRRRRQRIAQLEALQRSEDRLRWALWGSGDALWDWDLEHDLVHYSGREDAHDPRPPGPWNVDRVHPQDREPLHRTLSRHLRDASPHYEACYRIETGEGDWRWLLDRGRVVERDASGKALRMAGTQRDVTRQQAADDQQRIAASVIASMHEAVAVTDLELRFSSVNPAFERISGYRWSEVAGRPSSMLDSPLQDPGELARARQTLSQHGHWRGELWQRRRDGSDMLCAVELTAVADPQGRSSHYVAVLGDITERRRTEQELRYLANYDPLTGLPNRILLGQRLQQAMQQAADEQAALALLFLDLDHFKHVNDTMGHAAGDALLREVSRRLRQHAGDGRLLARLGGDEFTVLLQQLGPRPADAARERAEALLDAFREPIALAGGEVVVSPSIGIALYPQHGDSVELLLKHADTAMYAAKSQGRNACCLYSEQLANAARHRVRLEAALRRALKRDELRLVFQPQLSLPDLHLLGFEALLRWDSPEHGCVEPAQFIAIAEDSGLIGALGDWVLDRACRELACWRALGHPDLRVAVNVSVLQLLRGDLPQRVATALHSHGLPADALELELTESRLMANADQALGPLRALKDSGLRLAIDDFGTGYSSLAYLKRLPIDTLKIDRVFIADVATDPEDAAIVRTIVAMAHAMRLDVLAEGVEQQDQLAFLRDCGCDAVQGYLFAAALEPAQCVDLLNTRRLGDPASSSTGA